MKTTADLSLTEYQRGQLAHIRSLMRMETKEHAVANSVHEHDRKLTLTNAPTDETQRIGHEPRCIDLTEAKTILISAIDDFKEEETQTSKRGSAPLHRMAARKVEEKRRRNSLTKPQPKQKVQKQSPEIGKYTPADTHPTERTIPPVPVPKEPTVWEEKDETSTVPVQLLAMSAYSEARIIMERKQAELASLLSQLEQASDDDPEKLQQIRQQVEQLKPELQDAMQRVQGAEGRLKQVASNNE